MKNLKNILLSAFALIVLIVTSSFSNGNAVCQDNNSVQVNENNPTQIINMFVTHGHCSTPFAGNVNDLKV